MNGIRVFASEFVTVLFLAAPQGVSRPWFGCEVIHIGCGKVTCESYGHRPTTRNSLGCSFREQTRRKAASTTRVVVIGQRSRALAARIEASPIRPKNAPRFASARRCNPSNVGS